MLGAIRREFISCNLPNLPGGNWTQAMRLRVIDTGVLSHAIQGEINTNIPFSWHIDNVFQTRLVFLTLELPESLDACNPIRIRPIQFQNVWSSRYTSGSTKLRRRSLVVSQASLEARTWRSQTLSQLQPTIYTSRSTVKNGGTD